MSAETDMPASPCKQLEDGVNHLMQGKRHLLVKDYPSAVTSLANACALLSGKYGELAPECGEPCFYYGKALLELARVESGVLEMTPPKSDGSDEEEEDDDDENRDAKEDKEESESKEDSDEASKNGEEEEKADAGEDAENNDKEGTAKTENGLEASNGAGPSKTAEDEEEVGDDKDEEGEVNNLQLAWEVLETAKIIYQKQVYATNCKETKTRLAEVLLKLGEVGIESENWPTAIDDLKACLAMQVEVLDKDDRRLAETYYQLAVAHSNNNEYQESVDSMEKACNQLQVRIDVLEAKRPQEDMIKQGLIDNEIKQLKELLVEMKDRLSDIMVEKDEPTPKDDQDDVVKNGSDSKPAGNIAHLVRKKPKAEPSDPAVGSKTEVQTDNVDKTEGESKEDERKKRKSEDDDSAPIAALKKSKLGAEA